MDKNNMPTSPISLLQETKFFFTLHMPHMTAYLNYLGFRVQLEKYDENE
jgi:hypothetical protein